MSKVPHIHITIKPGSQISLRFALWPAVVELQAICAANDPKINENEFVNTKR